MGEPPTGPPRPLTAESPQVRLQQLIGGYTTSQTIYAITKLGIPDLLADGPVTAKDLAVASGAHRETLTRFLQALVGVDVIRSDSEDRYTLGALGEHLRSGTPGSLRSYAIHANEETYQAWGDAVHALRTGQPAFEHRYGTGFYDYMASHPDADAIWNDSMTETERAWTLDPGLVGAYDWHDARRVVDVGGGHGALIARILKAAPWATGILFDLPNVVAGAAELLDAEGVADRCEVVGGDAFEAVPAGGDLYVMSRVLFNWDDEKAAMLLRNCRQAMSSSGRLLIIEPLVTGESGTAGLIDLNVFMICGGRTRNAAQLDALFARAGLRFERFVPTPAAWHILEVCPAASHR